MSVYRDLPSLFYPGISPVQPKVIKVDRWYHKHFLPSARMLVGVCVRQPGEHALSLVLCEVLPRRRQLAPIGIAAAGEGDQPRILGFRLRLIAEHFRRLRGSGKAL